MILQLLTFIIATPTLAPQVDVNAQQLALTGCVMMCAPAEGSSAAVAAAAASAAAAAAAGSNSAPTSHTVGLGINVVVAEGGPRAVRKFTKLMTRRIRWHGDEFDGDDGDSSSDGEVTCCLTTVHHLFHNACSSVPAILCVVQSIPPSLLN
jgi:alkanesulfonate monooxygenase SsuD/methylene tetrahydromethanopterin reductase-like flavin-dependent oxidoreductase (luciferase family)